MSSVWMGAVGLRRHEERVHADEDGSTVYGENRTAERFAREQIRSLVRSVFCGAGDSPVKQVVFSAMDAQTEVGEICHRVGDSLALESKGAVAVVSYEPSTPGYGASQSISRRNASEAVPNLWLLPPAGELAANASTAAIRAYLSDLRHEFEYSIVAAPTCADSNQALTMAQFADGIILVVSAIHTRRAAARKICNSMAQVRVFGTVLSDREFSVPEAIYRRL